MNTQFEFSLWETLQVYTCPVQKMSSASFATASNVQKGNQAEEKRIWVQEIFQSRITRGDYHVLIFEMLSDFLQVLII